MRTVGMKVEVDQESVNTGKFEGMDAEQLKAYAIEHGIDIGNSNSVSGLIKKIKEAEKTA
jgi:hypothetical protein